MIDLLNWKKDIKLKDISKIEKKLKLAFPEDLKQHLLRWNGGQPEKNVFRLDESNFTIHEFLTLKYGKYWNIPEIYMEIAITDKRMPENLMPFAIDPGGAFFSIKIAMILPEGCQAIFG